MCFFLCLFGQRPRKRQSPVKHWGTFILPSICPFIHPFRPDICHLRHDICHFRPDICHLRPKICHLRPKICPLRPEIALSDLQSALTGLKSVLSDLKPALLGLKSTISDLKSALSGLKSTLLGPPRPTISPLRPHISPKDERTDERKFYRTLTSWGLLPCFLLLQSTIMLSSAPRIADHVLPLGDLFNTFSHFLTLMVPSN